MKSKSLKLINVGNLLTYNSKKKSMILEKDLEITVKNGKIIEIGKNLNNADQIYDCENNLVTPGFVDCHTHPVFCNDRSNEFGMRAAGNTYKQIAANGGGINNSVKSLRNSDYNELKQKVIQRMNNFLKLGTTTLEAKSGYGLDLDSELKSLAILDEINSEHRVDIIPTFMGAHAVPKEYNKKPDDYVDHLCKVIIPAVAKQGIARYNDVFCEEGYFDIHQSEKILSTGLDYGLLPRIHTDEFENIGGAQLASAMKCVSADHLMCVNDSDIMKMVNANVKAVLLPGTTFFLGKHKYAPYKKLKDSGLEVAIATDYNPGSCNIQSMTFIITLSLIYMGFDINDAIFSSTYMPSKILDIHDTTGSIEKGKNADIIVWGLKKPID
ncbi:MAG: imidazolonepropionase, partial [Candidatus Marinimicrobia bacterium]|nr:imidazolonepropionase [Candidatus Neomarinimicrobiota bacterium]